VSIKSNCNVFAALGLAAELAALLNLQASRTGWAV